MSLTGHDILTNADLFRASYPNWPSAEPDPLAGPFLTSTQITDSSDDEGFAIPWPPRAVSVASETTQKISFWRDRRTRPMDDQIPREALIHDLAIILRGVLHPGVEVGPPTRLASSRLRDVLGIKDGHMPKDVEALLRSALATTEEG